MISYHNGGKMAVPKSSDLKNFFMQKNKIIAFLNAAGLVEKQ